MDQFNKALNIAIKEHKGQKRKGTGDDYVVHPIRVATKILAETGNWDLATVGLLHDVVEDGSITMSNLITIFGGSISKLVIELTDTEEKKEMKKEDYWLKRWSAMSHTALIVKFYDRLDNIKDRPKKGYIKKTLNVLNKLEKQSERYPSQTDKAYQTLKRECVALLEEMK